MNQIRIYTLRDGTKRKIKIEEGMTLQDELKKLGITESDIFQMQLVIEGDKM
jgi:sulfur carrier protein ThiS